MNIDKFAQRYNELHTLNEAREREIEKELGKFQEMWRSPITFEELRRDVLYILELLLLQAEEKKRFKFGKTRIDGGLVFRRENGGLRYRGFKRKIKHDLDYINRGTGNPPIMVDRIKTDFGEILPDSYYKMLEEMNENVGDLLRLEHGNKIFCEIPCDITVYSYQSYGTPKFTQIPIKSIIINNNGGMRSGSFELMYKDINNFTPTLHGPIYMMNGLDRKVWQLIKIAQRKIKRHIRIGNKKSIRFNKIYAKYDYAKYLATRGI